MQLRLDDELGGAEPPAEPLDLRHLVGSWRNTDRGESGGVERLAVRAHANGLRVRGFGVGDPGPVDWGETDAEAFGYSVAGGLAFGFTCRFDFDFQRAEIAAYGKEGILIIVTYNSFDDASPRADYWTREFFNREETA
jgi:hypothetical protein